MEAIDRLPAGQRAVIILRDMEGCEAEEACTLLGITAENQRVLLHRARGRIRQTIDAVVGAPRSAAGDGGAAAWGFCHHDAACAWQSGRDAAVAGSHAMIRTGRPAQ